MAMVPAIPTQASHPRWMRVGAVSALTGYVSQIAFQFLAVSGLWLIQAGPLGAMDDSPDAPDAARKFLGKNERWVRELEGGAHGGQGFNAVFGPPKYQEFEDGLSFAPSGADERTEGFAPENDPSPPSADDCLKLLYEERDGINGRLKAVNQEISKLPYQPLPLLGEVDFSSRLKEPSSSSLEAHPLLKPLYDIIEEIKALEGTKTLDRSLQGRLQDLKETCEAYRGKLILKLQRDFIERELDEFEGEIIQKTRARRDHITPLVEEINKLMPSTSPDAQEKVKEKLSSFGMTSDNPFRINPVQPAFLTLPNFRESFLGDKRPSLNHLFLSQLKQILNRFRALSEDPCLKGSPLAVKLEGLAGLYEQAANDLCQANSKERIDLLSPVRLRLCRSPHSYFIGEDMAKEILSCDDLGLIHRENETGSTAVKSFGSLHFKRNFKKLRDKDKKVHRSEADYFKLLQDDNLVFEGTLDPGMEWGMYAFYTLLMGQGITPSSLIALQGVPQQVPKEGTEAYGLMAKILYPATCRSDVKEARDKLDLCLSQTSDFTRDLKEHAVQVSRTVPGKDLNAFLRENKESQDFDASNFSAMALASLLTVASDAKGDNFIVAQKNGKGHIVGIDNDAALGPFVAKHANGSHTVEARNMLFCLSGWMDKPIDGTIRQRLLSISPHGLIVEWLSLLKDQNQRYSSLVIEGQLNPVTFKNLYLLLRFQPESLILLTDRLVRLQGALRSKGNLTHQEAFGLLCSPAASYYRAIAGLYGNDPSQHFPRIYEKGKAVEAVLDREQRLEDGRTLKDLLESETTSPAISTGGAGARHQLLSDGIQELLDATDLAKMKGEKKIDFLESFLLYFPNQLRQAAHSSWEDPYLVQEAVRHHASFPLLELLLDKIPNALEPMKGVDSPLHTAVRHESGKTNGYIDLFLKKGVNLESLNDQRLTPLDLTMESRQEGLFAKLIDLGAGTYANVSVALKFFETLKEGSPTHKAFNRLMRRNQEIAWHIALNDILPTANKDGKGVAVETTNGKRYLVFPDQLFDEKGNVRSSVPYGRHKVGSVSHKGRTLYFKEYPELPGLEEAVGLLARRIMGFGAPFTELAKIHNRPFLISQGIEGPVLSAVLKDSPDMLKRLDPESLSAMILMAMIVNPEDGKPDNYIVERLPDKDDAYRLIGIDNDHAFVPAVSKEKGPGWFSEIVQVKTILYCLDQMNAPVHPSVREKIKALNIFDILEEWIRGLRPRNSLYRELFSERERIKFSKENSYLSIPFQKGAIAHLYERVADLQKFLTETPNLTHRELLRQLEPHLAHRYSKGFKEPMSVVERFDLIDAPFYRKDSKGNHETITKSGTLLNSMDIPLKESLTNIASKENAKSDAYQPNMALSELKSIRERKGAELLNAEGAKIDFAKKTLAEEDAFLAALKKGNFRQVRREIKLLNTRRLADDLLINDVPLENLLSINLSGAASLTQEILPTLAERAVGLRYLNLSRLPNLRWFAIPLLFFRYDPLVFPNLKQLYLDESPITDIYVDAPELQELSVKKDKNLKAMGIKAQGLQVFSCEESSLTDAMLTGFLLENPNLQQLNYKNCPNLTKDAIPERLLNLPSEEEVYQRFLNGALVYRPKGDGNDEGMITLPIRDLSHPLEGTFDLSRCGDTGRYLSISTGYRKGKKVENKDKVEIWLAPRFLVKRDLETTASHFKGIMDKWKERAAVGIFWSWWEDVLSNYDYLTSQNMDDITSENLYKKWVRGRWPVRGAWAEGRVGGGGPARLPALAVSMTSCFVFELR